MGGGAAIAVALHMPRWWHPQMQLFKHRPDWLAIDFYAGRPPHSMETIEEFNAYVARPQHPVVVVDEAGWKTYGTQLAPMPRVLEQMAIGEETLMIVRADDGKRSGPSGR